MYRRRDSRDRCCCRRYFERKISRLWGRTMHDLFGVKHNYTVLIQKALESWNVKDVKVVKSLSGKSGASVLLVDISLNSYNGIAILKSAVDGGLTGEISKHVELFGRGSIYSDHIPQIIETYNGSEGEAFLMTAAGGAPLEVDSIHDIDLASLRLCCDSVPELLLDLWNPKTCLSDSEQSAYSVLRSWVQKQLAKDSRVNNFLRDAGVDDLSTSFRFNDTDYPNPLVFDLSEAANIQLRTVSGFHHGDLHQGNILKSRSIKNQIYIIDFDSSDDRTPLFFDTSYLELSILLSHNEEMTSLRWQNLLSSLNAIYGPSDAQNVSDSLDQGLLYTLGILRGRVQRWVDSHWSARKDDLKKQILLSRVAAGINYANKKSLSSETYIDRKKRLFSILYAAESMRELIKYCRISTLKGGPILRTSLERSAPSTDVWRDVWHACKEFEQRSATFLLVIDESAGELPDYAQKALGSLPWSMIVDLDPKGTSGNFSSTALPTMKARRAVVHAYPHQLKTYDATTNCLWVVATAPDATGGRTMSLASWKALVLAPLRTTAMELFENTTPKPLIALVLCSPQRASRVRHVVSALQEVCQERFSTVVLDENQGSLTDTVAEEVENHVSVSCSSLDFVLGIYHQLGDPVQSHGLWFPARHLTAAGTTLVPVEPEQAASYAAVMEIVPAGPYFSTPKEDTSSPSFLEGNTITWDELSLRTDVERDVTKAAIQHIRARLSTSPTESFSIEHTPGAGGTTVSRRIGWELRDEFPCVIPHSFSRDLVDLIDNIFQFTSLPLLIIVESTRMAAGNRDLLFSHLKSRNVRFVILDVKRRFSPQNTKTSIALADPMTVHEASRFYSVYSALSTVDRRPHLKRLASDKPSDREYSSYRSAFFFGLYTFEKDFARVPDFVAACMQECSTAASTALAYLALISRYSQERLPIFAFYELISIELSDMRIDIERLIGAGPARLVLFDGRTIGIKHPLLADEIVRYHLAAKMDGDGEYWRALLPDFVIEFIKTISRSRAAKNSCVREILYDIFLERHTTINSTRSQFSELLHRFDSAAGERRVLETLCECFPDDAAFFSHLARHINLRKSGSFTEALQAAEQAIALDDRVDDHYHVLGMIYRFEIEKELGRQAERKADAAQALRAIRDLFVRAMSSFDRARDLRSDNKYPFITPIQLIVTSIERLWRLSGEAEFVRFLGLDSEVSAWCRDQLDLAYFFLEEIHLLEANGQPDDLTVRCETDIETLLGHYENVIAGLRSLLNRSDVSQSTVRRLLANAYVRRCYSTVIPDTTAARRSASLCLENLALNPTNIGDLRMWIRSSRVLRDFSLSEAIDRFTQASLLSDHAELAYYLAILHFIGYLQGSRNGLSEARRYFSICTARQDSLMTKISFEWMTALTQRPLPLVHHSELGLWSREKDFFEGREKLSLIEGRIDEIRSPQAGTISIEGMPAFFVPRSAFTRSRDLNARVRCNIGFSFEGLRAWNVERT